MKKQKTRKKNAYKIEAFWRNEIHHKCLTFDRESKKTNLCSWSLEIKIETFWDKNGNFRRKNEHEEKKQKTKKKRIQMQIEVKKENVKEDGEGKRSTSKPHQEG